MAKQTFSVRWNADDTVTIKVGRNIEHITIIAKNKAEVFEAVKWALISKGISVSDLTISESLGREGW